MRGLEPADLAALRSLSDSYAAAADDRDLAAVSALFDPNGVLAVPDPPRHLSPQTEHRGQAAVEAALGALTATLATTHVVAGARYEARSTGARGRVRGIAHHVLPGREGLSDLVWFLHYDDEYARTSTGWVIVRRDVTIDWIERHRVSLARTAPPQEGSTP